MPTAARLVSLVTLAALGWFLADILQVNVAGPQDKSIWLAGMAGIGACVGWMQLGKKVGNRMHQAMFSGVAAVITGILIAIVVGALFLTLNAMQYHAYRDIEDLFNGLTRNLATYLNFVRDEQFLVYAAAGGCLSGLIAEMTHRTWR